MRPARPLLPIRPLALPARLGRRQRWNTSPVAASEVRARFEQSNLAVALAARPIWLRGPLFKYPRPQPSAANARHAA
ncbi:MAG: hypothetical protein H7Y06_01530 [Opitutaceae bacterium]|nr:hypothetical protein [Opitutaceae bacterium]